MIDSDEIIIDADIDKNKDLKSKKSKEKQIKQTKIVEIEGITGNKMEENKKEIEENNKFENINETEINNNSNDLNNNILNQLPSSDRKEYNLDKKITSQKESSTTINNTNILDNISTIPTKEEQNQDLNIQNQNINTSQKGIQQSNIIDESDEYKSLKNIINSQNNYPNQRNNNNILNNNNKLYFTEANIPIIKFKKVLQKSNSNELYNISTIPEYPNRYQKKVQNSIKRGGSQRHRSKNSVNNKLNNLSPKDYLKKKYVNKYNYRPLQYRIKKIEEEVEKQNKYDYQRVMKELQLKYDKERKDKEKERNIIEFHKKLEEKLKSMKEKRAILYKERLEKITRKINNSNSKIKIKKNLNKSCENNIPNNNSTSIITTNNSHTIDSYIYTNDKNEKLPHISSMPRYEIIKLMKEKIEDDFCDYTKKILNEKEISHRKNYLKQLFDLNNKITNQNKLYKQRSMKCLFATRNRDAELEEEFIEKDIIKRYKIKQILLRERSAKKERINHKLMKNLDNLKQKRELIEKNDEEKIRQVLKRLNKDVKRESLIGYSNRDFFANLQKRNLIQYNKDINDYYNDLIYKQGEKITNISEFQNKDNTNRQNIIKRNLREQNKKFKKLENLDKYLDKMDKININNQNEGIKRKMYYENIKSENEEN